MKIYSEKIPFDPAHFPHFPLNPKTEFAQITMENRRGMRVCLLNYGCVVHRLEIPDLQGKMHNLVLSLKDPQEYFDNPAYLGALIGRTAGRIGDGSFHLGKKLYPLAKNYGDTSAHGGAVGFDKHFFDYELLEEKERVSAVFSRFSPDGEEGYPGNLRAEIRFTLSDQNELSIDMQASSDADTLVNFTNHSYFNLHGNTEKEILSHSLQLNGAHFAPILENGVVSGQIESVENSPFDFREPKSIGRDLSCDHPQLEAGSGYDHFFFFDPQGSEGPVLSLREKSTGLSLDLFTDCEGAVLYSQNYPIPGLRSSEEQPAIRRGLAIEPSAPPIGKNGEFLPFSLLRKDEAYRRHIRYRFRAAPPEEPFQKGT
ncbi:MAG: aldose epimerase family protein [Peptostreptococcaceae bacterium]|nr:aldose epimerase family protein [Peptostreptococcaceae bacterium]